MRHPDAVELAPAPHARSLAEALSLALTHPSERDRLLSGYAAAAGPYDEMLAADGSVRPHWRAFVDGFAGLGTDGRAAAGESTRRLLRESGIAFNVYADPDDRAHAWRLDLVPVLLPDAEWDRLAAGIVQRARLIDAVLADLHGAPDAAARRQPAGVAAAGQPGLRPRQRRPRRAGAPLSLHLRLRHRPHRVGRLGRARRPDRHRDRQRLRPGQPGGAQPRSRGAVPRLPHAAPRPLLPGPAGELPGLVPARRRPDRDPQPGAGEPVLFQPLLSGALSRLHGRRRAATSPSATTIST